MKVCDYCGTECEEQERVCPSCGGDSFKAKCHNCGTVFDSAACPNCGVKAGDTGKVCPQCQTKYFSNACPNCGYMPLRQDNGNPPPQTLIRSSGCNLLFWILGWIFLFPVPLTILISRNRNLTNALKACIIIVAWVAYFLLAFVGSTSEGSDSADRPASDYTVSDITYSAEK